MATTTGSYKYNTAVLAAVTNELQMLIGGKVQRISQPQSMQVVIAVFKASVGERHLLLDCSPRFYRAHLTTRRLPNPPAPPAFCMTLRKHLMGARVLAASQRDGDRILDLQFENAGEEFLLTAELMGKHANILLVSSEGRVLQAAKLITAKQSRVREVLPGREYSPPPAPTFSTSPVAGEKPISSAELDEYFAQAEAASAFEQKRNSLLGTLRKVRRQKARALQQVQRGAHESTRADEFQKFGDLILSQLHAIAPGAGEAELADYFAPDVPPIVVPLNPDLSPQENAQKYFHKARRARESTDELQQLQRQLEAEVAAAEESIAMTESPDVNEDTIRKLQQQLAARGWLHASDAADNTRAAPGKAAASKALFDGKKVRMFRSPDGYQVLVGENAEANDYLVTRQSQSNDWWLHLRSATSSHAIIKTNNAPDRVPLSTLLFAARLVVARSVAKHAGWAEVDYTLRKYVRKPRKAPPGSVLISNQKTLRVEPETAK